MEKTTKPTNNVVKKLVSYFVSLYYYVIVYYYVLMKAIVLMKVKLFNNLFSLNYVILNFTRVSVSFSI